MMKKGDELLARGGLEKDGDPPGPTAFRLPLVSVQMIVWNGERFIAEAVESVLNQTYPNIELVVVDDGSTDGTRAIIEGFQSDRIRYICKEHAGVAPARNEALKHCRGDYIAILDSDDVYEPEMLETEVRTLRENPGVDAVYTNLNIIDAEGKETGVLCNYRDCSPKEMIPAFFIEGCNTIPFGSLMLKKESADRVGPFDESFPLSEDTDYIMRMARWARFKHIDAALYRCRRHGSNISDEMKSRKERARATGLLLAKMLALFSREDLCPEIPWEELSPQAAEAAFNVRVGSIFWNHCQSFFHSGGFESLLEQAKLFTEKGLKLDPAHRDGNILLGKIRFLSELGNGNLLRKNSSATGEADPSDICPKIIQAGWYFVDKRRLEEGEASFSMILGMKWLPMPLGMEALLGLGKTAWLKGKERQAKAYYTQALQLLSSYEHNACLSRMPTPAGTGGGG